MGIAAIGRLGGRLERARPAPQMIDFQRLLGEVDWAALPAAVRARFTAHAGTVVYAGQMVVRANGAGWLIAQLCRLIGTPLAPGTGEAVPVAVSVYMDRGALVWDRRYDFGGRAPVLVSSRKTVDADGGLLEVVRGGLGMALSVNQVGGALHFRSRFYFLQLGGARLVIPALLTPGAAHVVHEDLGEGRFRFALSFCHPWLGETFFQDGVFADPG